MGVPSQDRFDRLAVLFDAAVQLPPQERAEFLQSMDGPDVQLREDLVRLLASDAEVQQKPSSLPNRLPRFGIYQARELIGAGGMGAVYLATREDGEVRQQVAVKAIASAFVSPLLEERLRRERQILAELHHPNIAAFLDGGVTSDGFPYLVMEFVKGEAIDVWCDARRLPVNLRLELFLKVCTAVNFAHQRQVVHRDLKPANILVTAEGEPKLLDFGIARTLSGETTQLTTELFVTPRYSSPEVLRGEPATVASEVYSLGVLLYELLSGNRPFARIGASVDVIDRVLSSEPAPLSAAIGKESATARGENSASLSRRLRGDLESIVAKAMAKTPDQRYGSVQQLGDEIRRHLTGQPVQASAHRPFYVARKRFARHRSLILGIAAVILSILLPVWYLKFRAASPPPSVAVLPFQNLTGDGDNEFIGDGITEELSGALGESTGLRVVAHSSAFQFKHRNANAREVGRVLNVTAILQGSVSRQGNQLQITAQLIRSKDGDTLWSHSYNSLPADLQSIEAEIARASRTVLLPVSEGSGQTSGLMTTSSPEAHDLYLRAMAAYRRGTLDSTRLAASLSKQSIEKDPSYPLPYWLAYSSEYTLSQFGVTSPREIAGSSMAFLEKAIQLNPEFGDAHASHALSVYTINRDWPRAEAEFQIAVHQHSSLAPSLYGWSLMTRGRFREAHQQMARAEELDPIAAGPRLNRAIAWQVEGNFSEARAELQRVLELNPENPSAISLVSGLDLEQRRCSAADADYERLRRINASSPLTRFVQALSAAVCGNPEDARKTLAALQAEHPPGINFYQWALVHAALHDTENVLADLEKATDGLETQAFYLKIYVGWKPYRNDPRYVALVHRLGLDQ